MEFVKKRLPALLLALALVFSTAACGEKEEETTDEDETTYVGDQVVELASAEDNVFSVNYDSAAAINPITAQNATNTLFWSLMYDGLFNLENDFTVTSEIVKEYTSSDYEWWVFYINTDIMFSDGMPLTAKDIVYSINRARQYEYYMSRLDCIYGISAMGDDCFAISLAAPNSQLPALLNVPIIKEGTLNEAVPTGSGPYMMDESGDKLKMNEYYRHASQLPVDTVYLKDYKDTASKINAFEASLIDIVTNDPTGMFNLGYGSSNEVRYYETTNMHYIGFNFSGRYFNNALARYAVCRAIDRAGIIENFMPNYALPATLPVHPVSTLYNEELAKEYGFNLEKSEQLFKNSGVEDFDRDGVLEVMITGIVVEIDIKFICNTDSTVKLEAARQLTETLNEMGIKVTLHELAWDDYIEALEKGDYDMYYGEVRMTPDWDLSYLFKPYKVTSDPDDMDKGMNYANCFDEQYGSLYTAYLGAGEEGRQLAYNEVLNYVMGQCAIAPICFERQQVLTHRGVISGIDATQYDVFNKFYEWTINLE